MTNISLTRIVNFNAVISKFLQIFSLQSSVFSNLSLIRCISLIESIEKFFGKKLYMSSLFIMKNWD